MRHKLSGGPILTVMAWPSWRNKITATAKIAKASNTPRIHCSRENGCSSDIVNEKGEMHRDNQGPGTGEIVIETAYHCPTDICAAQGNPGNLRQP